METIRFSLLAWDRHRETCRDLRGRRNATGPVNVEEAIIIKVDPPLKSHHTADSLGVLWAKGVGFNHWLNGLRLAALMALCTLPAFTVGAQERFPLNCTIIDDSLTSCLVRVDRFDVTDVVLNRGNCPSPVITKSEKSTLDRLLESQALKANSSVQELRLSMGFMSGLALGMCSLMRALNQLRGDQLASEEAQICQMSRLMILDGNNPIGTYKFGDKFNIATFECANLLEIKITANGQEWLLEN
jgi:hypothetical protein